MSGKSQRGDKCRERPSSGVLDQKPGLEIGGGTEAQGLGQSCSPGAVKAELLEVEVGVPGVGLGSRHRTNQGGLSCHPGNGKCQVGISDRT